ncbi:MAG TPA: hypothetical protein VNL98_08235 [Gemmatimonadales bacterium]|nr:hypothetical protein [Gemmatimonadales bacterium]
MTGSAWLIGAAGAWLAASTFLGVTLREHAWAELGVGMLAGVLGLRIARAGSTCGWIAAALGAWLVAGAVVPAFRLGVDVAWYRGVIGAGLVAAGFIGVSGGSPVTTMHLFPRLPSPRGK